MGKKVALPEIGHHYGKPDIERIGLFVEMPYMNGKGYVSPFLKLRRDKGLNMMCEGRKIKDGTQAGYFDKEFKRLFTGECIPGRGRKPPKPMGKNVSQTPMIPPGCSKKHGCPGDYHGTFSGNIEAFSNVRKKQPPYKKQLPNCLTSPGKKGGPGYANITLSKYPEHSVDRYAAKKKTKELGRVLDGPMLTVHYPKPYFDLNPYMHPDGKVLSTYAPPKEKVKPFRPPGILVPTGPGKWQGGSHAGCFNKFPEHKPDKYVSIIDANKPRASKGKYFYPQSMGMKSLYSCSVLNNKVDIAVNAVNYKTYEPNYTRRLLGS